jgi:hypothetical protein
VNLNFDGSIFRVTIQWGGQSTKLIYEGTDGAEAMKRFDQAVREGR